MNLPIRRSGRPPGSPNKLSRKFHDLIIEYGFDAAEQFVWIYSEAKENYLNNKRSVKALEVALNAASEIASYCYPKLKSVEHSKISALDGMTPEQKLEAMKQAVALMELEVKNEPK